MYLPARFRRNRRYPLLIVHDGADYLRFADLQTVLDNVTYSLEIPQMIVALTQSEDRLCEYAADERHAGFLAEELLPYMNSNFPLIDEPRARGLMGASFGGVYTLWATPVPIPNTEVKTQRPMVLHMRESRSMPPFV